MTVIESNATVDSFQELGISVEILKGLGAMGFEKPSPIQAQGIPPVLEGRDVIGQAQTGTGKTAAFGIPVLERIDTSINAIQALILCPTRELAVQVSEELKKISQFLSQVKIEAIYGGDSIERQIRSLRRGVHIVVGTPGRVMDHMERRTLELDHVRMMVLDEADEMLDMGFREDIENILTEMPEDRQTILFSATMSKPILAITRKFLVDPVLIKVVKNELTNQNIEQVYFEVKPQAKVEVMTRLIDMHDIKSLLVFCNTKRKVDEIVEELQLRGYAAEGLHGDLRQQQRNNVMSKFKAGVTTILVATDVAARGIDVSGLDAVINYDIPLDEEYYVHRIGRTGRAGMSGKAFSLVARDEKYRLRGIETYAKAKIEKGVIPSFQDILGVRKARFIDTIAKTINESQDISSYEDILESLRHSGFTVEQIVGAMAKKIMGVQKNEYSDANLAWEEKRSDRRGEDRWERRGDRKSGGRFENRGDRRGNDRFGDRRGGFGGKRSRTVEAGMTRLFFNLGRQDHLQPRDFVGAIAGEANIPGTSIGVIDIHDKFTYVDIPERDVRTVLHAMDGNTIKGKQVNVDVAR
ncbi:MAG: DEAD/DEAH box helicase [Spirosomataceae bacterium]